MSALRLIRQRAAVREATGQLTLALPDPADPRQLHLHLVAA